jgi:hypothetical protein
MAAVKSQKIVATSMTIKARHNICTDTQPCVHIYEALFKNYWFFAFIKTYTKTITLCSEPATCRFIDKSSSGILHVQRGF